LSFLAQLLRPSSSELYELVLRETDPRQAGHFDQVCPGKALTILALLAIGISATAIAPFRIVRRLLAKRG
jgi:hypothetical protein